jgi:hypothetical protein
MRAALLLLICCLISSASFAEVLLDFGGTYFAETFKTPSDSGNTQYFYNVDVLFNLDHRGQWNLGWTVFGISQNSTVAGVDTTYSSLDIGPALRWNIDKSEIYSLTVAYGYSAKGNYNSGGNPEDWAGTSYLAQFAVQAPVRDDKFYVGFNINYYAASYIQKTINSVVSSNTAQKTWIFPMISFTWRP